MNLNTKYIYSQLKNVWLVFIYFIVLKNVLTYFFFLSM